jgi:hypothetical protein
MLPVQQARPPTPVVRQGVDTIVVHLDSFQIGDAVKSSWALTLNRNAPTFTLDRVDTVLRPNVAVTTALAVTSAANEPHDRLVLVSGTAYTLTPIGIDRIGNHGLNGVISRDPGLMFTVTSSEITRARGERLGDRDVLMLVNERTTTAGTGMIPSSAKFHVGPRVPVQQASSRFNPQADAFLLTAGYYGNVFVSDKNGRVLTASMVLYPDSVWLRDIAYATSAYGYVLEDTTIWRNIVTQFIKRTSDAGVVPEYFNEAGLAENRDAWDAMPDLIHATYAYVSKSRDRGFILEHRVTLERVMAWIRALDSDNDGLPDRDIFPYGYFDSVENSVMHTYAIASFYSAHLEMAEMFELAELDGSRYRGYAEQMRVAFNRPVSAGGYWQPDRGYPLAWKKTDGRMVTEFETFGVLAAVRCGLITDEENLRSIGQILRDHRDEFVNQGAFPTRLMLGGYPQSMMREGMRADQSWVLDANAPWVVGHDVAVRAKLVALDDAAFVLARYLDATVHYPPMAEFSASTRARYGQGTTGDGGRLWDNAAWFDAVYGTHYGLRMTPTALIVQPNPLRSVPDDMADNILYQGLRFRLTLQATSYTFSVSEGPPRTVVLQPVGRHQAISVNGGPRQPAATLVVRPGETYTVQSFDPGA